MNGLQVINKVSFLWLTVFDYNYYSYILYAQNVRYLTICLWYIINILYLDS